MVKKIRLVSYIFTQLEAMANQTDDNAITPKNTAVNKKLAEERARTRKYLLSGALWTFSGFVLLVITLIRGSGTKGHVVVWAVFLLGIIQFFRGLARLKK